MLAHEASQFIVIDDHALLKHCGLHAAIATDHEAVGDRCNSFDEGGVVEADRRPIVAGRARDSRQTASFKDGDAPRPVMTDVVEFLGRCPCFIAPCNWPSRP